MRRVLVAMLCVGCSGQVDDDLRTRRDLLEVPTVCSSDPSLDAYIQWSVDYWWERGHQVEWVPGSDCAVTVSIAHDSGRETRHCYDDNPATDGWCNGETALFDRSRIVLRLEPWERFDEAWRAYSLTHEVGHVLGIPHSAEGPMWSCEVEAWCFGDVEVQAWWDSQE